MPQKLKALLDPTKHPIAFNLYHTIWMAAVVALVYYFHLWSIPVLVAIAALLSDPYKCPKKD